MPIDPLHIMGMQLNLEDKTKKFSLQGFEIYSHVKKTKTKTKQVIVQVIILAAFPRTCTGSIVL